MGEDKTEGKSLWSLLMQNKETEISHTWLPNKLLDPSHFGLLISCTSLTKISQNHPKISNKSSKVHPQPEHWPPQVLWIQWAATSAAADRFTVLPASFRALCAAWLPALLWLGAKKKLHILAQVHCKRIIQRWCSISFKSRLSMALQTGACPSFWHLIRQPEQPPATMKVPTCSRVYRMNWCWSSSALKRLRRLVQVYLDKGNPVVNTPNEVSLLHIKGHIPCGTRLLQVGGSGIFTNIDVIT